MRSPKSDFGHSRSSRLSFNIFYFAIGDAQKDSGLEIEFMLDTGASCSSINYRTVWEISQFQHPIMVHRSRKLSKTSSELGYATLGFSYDPNREYSFPLTVRITEMKTQNLLGMDFCQNQAPGTHFDSSGIELRQPPKTLFYGSVHQNKTFPYVSRILMVRLPYTMYVDAKEQDVGSTRLETRNLYFLLDQLFNPTGKRFPQVLFLLISYALSLNQPFQY